MVAIINGTTTWPQFFNGLNDTGIRKNNFTAARAPLSSDNASQGYERGSRWVFGADEWFYTGTEWQQNHGIVYKSATVDGIEEIGYVGREVVVIDTASLTGHRNMRIPAGVPGALGGMIRHYAMHTGAFQRQYRVMPDGYFKGVDAGRYVEFLWNGAAWIVLRDVPI